MSRRMRGFDPLLSWANLLRQEDKNINQVTRLVGIWRSNPVPEARRVAIEGIRHRRERERRAQAMRATRR
jgi:hypothetical protein